MRLYHCLLNINLMASVALLWTTGLHAAELRPTGLQPGDSYGSAGSLSDGSFLTGAYRPTPPFGESVVFFFRQIQINEGLDTQEATLVLSPGSSTYSSLGISPESLSGSMALLNGYQAAFLYRNLDTATGVVHESARLLTSNGNTLQGEASLSGNNALLGGPYYGFTQYGEVFFYRNLDRATGIVLESAKLSRTDPQYYDHFGETVSLSGSRALVGANDNEHGAEFQGAAYYYRDLSQATGTVLESAKLVAPSAGRALFGSNLSLEGDNALIGGGDLRAYYFHHLDAARGVITTNVHLLPTIAERRPRLYLPIAVSLSGNNALIGLTSPSSGAYLFRHLDTAKGEIPEDVEIVNSQYLRATYIGESVSLEGDVYAIGDPYGTAAGGVVHTGSISALTTLDFGNTRQANAAISFNSRVDWIIGENTDANQIDLLAGDGATVKEPGKAVYIGKNAGSDSNRLDLAGTLKCNFLYIGSPAGNVNNILQLESTALLDAGAIRLANGNRLLIAGDQNTARKFLSTTKLQVWTGGAWVVVTDANYRSLVRVNENGGYTVIVPL